MDDDASAELKQRVALFLAAPDMLGALELVRMSNGWNYLSGETQAIIGAAIAKATKGA